MRLTQSILAVCMLCILLNNNNLFGQWRGELGEGQVTIGLYTLAEFDTLELDTCNRLFIKYNYHIKNQFVRRTAAGLATSRNSVSKDSSAEATISVSMFEPDYLINFDKKIVYTFKDTPSRSRKNGDVDSLEGYTDDYCYRIWARREASAKNESARIDTSELCTTNVLGMIGYQGRYKMPADESWTRFTYTKQKLSFISPLAGMVPGFPYPILNVLLPINDPKDPRKKTGNAFFSIIDFRQAKQDDQLFNQTSHKD